MKLWDLSWKEVEKYLIKYDDILIPIGSIEEHGYHLQLSTDAFIAERIAEEVSKGIEVLIAPVICYGVCRSTAAYPGTISVTFNSFKRFIYDILSSLYDQGFKRLYLFTAHGGNAHIIAIEEAARFLKRRKDVFVYLMTPKDVDLSDVIETRDDLHAGEIETSLMLYLAPDRVKLKEITDEKLKKGLEVIAKWRPTESGVFGRPSLATKEKGQEIFNRFVKKIIDLIKEARGVIS